MDIAILIFTTMSGIGAIGAVIVGLYIFFRQKKISLFQRRRQILDDYECFLFDELPNWEWDGKCNRIIRYSDEEIKTLFDESFLSLKLNILSTAEKCNQLLGDIQYAKNHGSCNGKTDYDIECDLTKMIRNTQNEYSLKIDDYCNMFKI